MWFYSPPQREYDFLRIESKWQERWREARLFETDPDSLRPKFLITVPYPYTSGPLHIGHGRTYTLGDIFARYVRMKGYNTLFPMAFHITGTPILAIAKRIASNHAGYRDLYREYVKIYVHEDSEIERHLESFREPRPIADFFSRFISQDFQAMGYSIDWRRSFSTGDQDYQAFVTWQFRKLHVAGYLKQGKHPLLYCLACQNAVGEDDIEDGDVIGAKVVHFVGVKFQAGDRSREFLVAATVRPETIYGCTNLWVNPEADYVEAHVDGETWIVSEKAAEKLQYQDHDVQVRKRIPGRDLVGRTVQNPATEQSLIVLPADFVDDDSGTGVVYSVPAHAPYDLVALKDLAEDHGRVIRSGLRVEDVSSIKPLSIIEVQGYGDCPAAEAVERIGAANQRDRGHLDEATRVLYEAEFYHGMMRKDCGKFAGLPASEAKDAVTKWLASIGMATTIFETSVKPVRCKDGGKVIAAVLGQQWFLNYGDPDWKKTARQALANMTIHPEVYRKLFENTFDWLDMRPCARRRGLGTPFPLEPEWIIESLSDSTIYMAFYTIIHHIRSNGIKPEQLTSDVFDYLFLGKGDSTQLSHNTGIFSSLLERMHEEFSYWYPVDLRHTGIGHITNHLSFYIFHHVAIFPPKHWPLKITLNEFLISEGAKMSKSKGNVVPLAEVPRKYGADLVRLYMAYAADLATLMDWREQQLAAVTRSLGKYWRLAESMTYRESKEPSHLSFISTWMLSRVNSTVEQASSAISQHSFREYAQAAFFDFMNLVEDYVKWSADIEDAEREFALNYSADRWIRILAPLTPHVCEELWEKRGAEGFVSAAPWPSSDPARINRQADAEMALVLRTIDDVKEISKVAKTNAAKLYVYVSPAWKFKVLQKVRDVGQDKPVKELMTALMADPELKKAAKDVAGLVSEVKAGRRVSDVMSQEREVQALTKTKNIVRLETGLQVEVVAVRGQVYDPKGKARTALPGRPALYLE